MYPERKDVITSKIAVLDGRISVLLDLLAQRDGKHKIYDLKIGDMFVRIVRRRSLNIERLLLV